MSASPHFPDDENGDILRRMVNDGDDLSKPRMMDFCFIFKERQQALAFADLVDEREFEVCISYYKERDMWQAEIHRYMMPTHQEITVMESVLRVRAESVGGVADGWGCMIVNGK